MALTIEQVKNRLALFAEKVVELKAAIVTSHSLLAIHALNDDARSERAYDNELANLRALTRELNAAEWAIRTLVLEETPLAK